MLSRYDIKITRRAMNRGRPFPATASRLSTFYPATPAATAPASPGAALQPPADTMTDSVVLKKLAPGAAGARRLAARRIPRRHRIRRNRPARTSQGSRRHLGPQTQTLARPPRRSSQAETDQTRHQETRLDMAIPTHPPIDRTIQLWVQIPRYGKIWLRPTLRYASHR